MQRSSCGYLALGTGGLRSIVRGELTLFFFFNDTPTPEIYTTANTLSLHDALPIYPVVLAACEACGVEEVYAMGGAQARSEEHTSELQSLAVISYAVFCLKKKT